MRSIGMRDGRRRAAWAAGLFDPDFWQAVIPLALPIALQNLLMTSFRLVDTLMIGQLGDASIAAVGLAGQVSFFVELLCFGLASGSAVFIAQYHGAGNRDGVLRSYGATMMFAIPVGLAATILCTLKPEAAMRLFTEDLALIEEGAKYLRYASWSFFGISLYQGMCITLRCTGQVRIPMVTSIISAVANAVLNYAFIFGVGPLPYMGVAGAGLATAITSIMNPVLMFCISVKQKNILISPLKKLLDVKGFLGTYWKRVLPVLLNEATWSLSVVGLNMVFGRMGAENYAGLTVFRTVENIVFVFFVGVCNASNILVGTKIGAGEVEEGKAYAKRFLLLAPIMGLILGAILIPMRVPVLSLFDISPAAHRTAMLLLLMYAVDVGIRNIPYFAVVGIFRAGGDTRIGLIVDIASMYGLVLPITALCGLVWKLPFLWTYLIMLAVDDLSKMVVYLPHFFSMKWIQPVSVKEESPIE